jgi:tetratricopeptide (TPR) repeat protein
MLRGAMFAEKGDTIKALTDFEQAIGLDKYFAPSYGQRGLLYLQKSEYKQALEDFDQAIKLDDQNIGYFINRGLARYYLNDLRGAMSDYDQVVLRDSRNVVARFNRGLLRAQVGDDNRAIEDFNEVIAQEPDNFMAIYNRVILKDQTGDFHGAIADLNAVLTEYPNFVPGFYYRSELKRKMNDTKGADRDYWYAYDLEQNLRKEQERGKQVTGKGVIDAGTAVADNSKNDDKTREKSDKNIEKFNRLVVYDKEEQQESSYKSELRGRVQDRQVKVDLMPQFVITYYERDKALKKYSYPDKMVEDYNNRKALKLKLKIMNNEAALTDDQADFHFQSINEYSLMAGRDEKNTDALFGRGLDYMVLQDLTEAQADFTRVIELDSKFAMAYFNRAVVRYKQMELETYNSANSESSGISLNLQAGRKLASGGQYAVPQIQEINTDTKKIYEQDMIIRDYDAVLNINPDFVYAYFNRGNMRCVQKDFRTAILDYNEAIRREPDFAEAYFNRGLSRLYLGDTQRGIEDLSKAGELGIVDAYNIIKRMSSE